ncbi:MAG: sigma 54-interacting transcriptional regulator [Myxococcales bacterium]
MLADPRILEAALRLVPYPIALVEPDSQVVFFNRAAERCTGFAEADVLGKPLETLARFCRTTLPLGEASGSPLGHMAVFEALADAPVSRSSAAMGAILGRSPAIRAIVDTVRRLGPSEAAVLVTGESGTGKELVARAVHAASRRSKGPFVPLNCAALPAELVESEVFGHVRGAFTGAIRDRLGAVEQADGGTFFLDEIGDMPMALQSKLLRLLQEKTFQRVGDSQLRQANIRVVSATHVDLARAVVEGRFRQDLLYRLRVIPLHLPPLRERPEDIVQLATLLLARRSTDAGRPALHFGTGALRLLETHPWPGNVRELVNVIDYVIALAKGDEVTEEELPVDVGTQITPRQRPAPRGRYASTDRRTDGTEAARIRKVLDAHGFHRQRSADALGMDRVTLYRKMREYGIDGPR